MVAAGAGNDWISGDRGSDTLTGGTGADTFHSFSGAGTDIVTDFNAADGDRVQLDAGIVWRLARDVALDASGVTSLAGPGPDWAVRAGVSVRFGR